VSERSRIQITGTGSRLRDLFHFFKSGLHNNQPFRSHYSFAAAFSVFLLSAISNQSLAFFAGTGMAVVSSLESRVQILIGHCCGFVRIGVECMRSHTILF
jgi:hypothetical protein